MNDAPIAVFVLALGRALQALAVGLAIVIAWRRPSYRPTAFFLLGAFLASMARLALRPLWAVPGPYVGAIRLAFHLEQGLFILWPIGLAALCRWTFIGRRPWPIVMAWFVAIGVLVLGYPTIRMDVHRKALLAIELASLAVSVAAWARFWAAKKKPGIEIAAATFLLVFELGTLAGPWLFGPFDAWLSAQVIYCFLYVTLVFIQGGNLWLSHAPSSSASSSSSSEDSST